MIENQPTNKTGKPNAFGSPRKQRSKRKAKQSENKNQAIIDYFRAYEFGAAAYKDLSSLFNDNKISTIEKIKAYIK